MLIDFFIMNMEMYFVRRDHLQKKVISIFYPNFIFGAPKRIFILNTYFNSKNLYVFLVKLINIVSADQKKIQTCLTRKISKVELHPSKKIFW